MNFSSTHNFPWELISGSLTGGLSNEEELRFQQWLASDPGHKEKYQQIREMWESGIEDYRLYLMADENKAWDALRNKLNDRRTIALNSSGSTGTIRLLYRVAASVAILVIAGLAWYWYASSGNTYIAYETVREEKQVKLADGSSVALGPNTRIEVIKTYNQEKRTIRMLSGKASFSVQHRSGQPFMVDLGQVYVEDLGTVFTVVREKGSVKVKVESGKVAFTKNSTKETKELTPGMSLTYTQADDSFAKIQSEAPHTNFATISLNFDNSPLQQVLDVVRGKFNKIVKAEDSGLLQKKFTAHLEGLDFETAMEIICKTLNLEYSVKDSIYTIQEKRDN